MIDSKGNIISKQGGGVIVASKEELDEEGDIPAPLFKQLFLPKLNIAAVKESQKKKSSQINIKHLNRNSNEASVEYYSESGDEETDKEGRYNASMFERAGKNSSIHIGTEKTERSHKLKGGKKNKKKKASNKKKRLTIGGGMKKGGSSSKEVILKKRKGKSTEDGKTERKGGKGRKMSVGIDPKTPSTVIQGKRVHSPFEKTSSLLMSSKKSSKASSLSAGGKSLRDKIIKGEHTLSESQIFEENRGMKRKKKKGGKGKGKKKKQGGGSSNTSPSLSSNKKKKLGSHSLITGLSNKSKKKSEGGSS